ncbi:cysteine hydrolase family protein [Olsenella profusa]|uniref:Cysteine hydrolase n=1 Tax=Olsenella profusa TaxID=138595 RepID=A0ABS2EZL4_9ACTN|nr:isochorismatase family cysteine hydrolase [Olsenella profusa]MBM6774159.1 cysteine hydrolase [Olsenella profusa]
MEINRNETALLVIDAIEAVGDDALYDPDAATAAYRAAVARTVDACHAAGVPVIFCNDAHVRGLDRELELWGEHGIAGETRVYPEVEVRPGDLTIPKRRYSGFFQTDLDLTLRELGVTTVIAVGCDTNICVLHTLADACFLGYGSVVVTDATMTFLCGTQEGALEHCEKCYGSALVTSEELAAALA